VITVVLFCSVGFDLAFVVGAGNLFC
jgi:hypothetical protein